ncbi:ABC transporter substrate-binding protein [Halosimplex amylolyticum]|uniref:ABC transporter substrate-binding protein n=1 Tax=Halosimplex amylolyticum TaxID=3396616 RepID=UPI003F5513CB
MQRDTSGKSTEQSVIDRRTVLKGVGASAALSGLAGCTLSGGGSNLKYWNIWTGGPQKNITVDVADDFTSQTDQEVEFARYSFNDYRTQIRNAITTEEAPDIFYTWAGPPRLGRYVENGQAIPIEDHVDSSFFDDFYDAAVLRGRFKEGDMMSWRNPDGKVWGIPISTPPLPIWYNKKVVEEAGIDPESLSHRTDISMSEFKELCQQVQDNTDKTPIMLGNKNQWTGGHFTTFALAKAIGAEEFNDRAYLKSDEGWNTEPLRQALSEVQSLFTDGYVNEDANGISNSEAINAWIVQDQGAFLHQGSWITQTIASVTDDDFPGIPEAVDYFWPPYFPDIYENGKNERFYMGDYVHAISQRAEQRDNLEKSVQMYEMLYSKSTMKQWLLEANQPITHKGAWDELESEGKLDPVHETLRAGLDQAADADATYDPFDLAFMPEPTSTLLSDTQEFMSGDLSPEEVLVNLQEVTETAIEDARDD